MCSKCTLMLSILNTRALRSSGLCVATPHIGSVLAGLSKEDARTQKTFKALGLTENSVDLVLTSPPYATALPYIDTDRLSLLVLFGMDSSARRPIEQSLIGSREIVTKERHRLEQAITDSEGVLPETTYNYLQELYARISQADVGFRRKNMPALLQRFFQDMALVMKNCRRVLRPRW